MKKIYKNALITGADRGLGYSLAQILANNGYNVCINYLHEREKIDSLCSSIQKECGGLALGVQADVRNNESLKKMFSFFEKNFGTLHLLVNNAGITEFAPFLETTEALWDKIIDTDLKGAFFCTQFAAKNMIAYGARGVIINISSNHAHGCWPDASVYGSAKAALSKFGKHAALELAPHGIRVITIEPGYTNTGWNITPVLEKAEQRIPLKRFASPTEIGSLVLYLASDAASYLTGCCIEIDGGANLSVCTENYFDRG